MGFLNFFKKDNSKTPEKLIPIFDKMKKNMEGKKLADEALSHRTLGNFDKAHSLLKKSLEECEYTPAMILIATTFIIQKEITKAIKWINKCIEEIGDNTDIKVELFANLGLIYLREIKDYNKSLTIYQNALSLIPADVDKEEYELLKSNIYKDIAWVYFFLKDFKNAYKYSIERLNVVSDCDLTLKLKNHLEEIFRDTSNVNSRISTAKDKYGNSAGKIIKRDDGKHVIEAGKNADYISVLISLGIIWADNILPTEKKLFAEWAGLSPNLWTSEHREQFAHSLLFYLNEIKNSDKINQIKPDVAGAIKLLPVYYNPTIKRPLTNDIIKIFNGLFGM